MSHFRAMHVAAKYVPLAYTGVFAAGLILALFTWAVWGPELPLSLAELGAQFPSRPLIQVVFAVTTLPQLLTIILWYLITRSRVLAVLGLGSVITRICATYVTQSDSRIHGEFNLLNNCFVAMLMVYSVFWLGNIQVLTQRRYITAGYVGCLVFSIHYLSKFLISGKGLFMSNFWKFPMLVLDLWFFALCSHDFEGLELEINYCQKHVA